MGETEELGAAEQAEQIQKSLLVGGKQKSVPAGKTILMVIAQEDFKDEEYFVPKSRFESAGFAVKTVSGNMGMATSVGGQEAEVLGVEGEDGTQYEAVVFVGGPGITAYYTDTEFQLIAKQAFEAGKIIGAICLAPNILANAWILNGREATVFGNSAQLVSHGAKYTGERITIDGNIVTAIGPEAAPQFADAIVALLTNPD